MKDTDINQQINALNNKVDLLLDYVNQQRLSTQSVQDLINDASIIGKDVYDSTVEELDKRQVDVQPAQLTELAVSFLRNINSFNVMMSTFESVIDLSKDLSPIINESLIDLTKMMAELEAKGYFEKFTKILEIGDQLMSQISMNDLNDFSEKLPQWIELMKSLSGDKTLQLAKMGVGAVAKTDFDHPPQIGMLRLMKEMNSPEMKKSMGIIISMAKNLHQ